MIGKPGQQDWSTIDQPIFAQDPSPMSMWIKVYRCLPHLLTSLFFLAMGVGAVAFLVHQTEPTRAWVQSEKPVLSIDVHKEYVHDGESIAADYSFEVDGQIFKGNRITPLFRTAFSFSPAKPQYAYYDPNNPLDSALSRGYTGMVLIFMGVGVILIALAGLFSRMALSSFRKAGNPPETDIG